MRHEKDNVVRTACMDGRARPDFGMDFSWQGHSIGRYENGEFVVPIWRCDPAENRIERFR